MTFHRLLQIRLRTVLLLMFVAALGALWYGRHWREENRRHAAIQYLLTRGAAVRIMPSLRGATADVTFDESGMIKAASSAAFAGSSFREGSANFWFELTLEDFEQLRQVPRLTSLSIQGIMLTQESLAGIATLAGLERLDISHSPLDDKGLLELVPLTKLRELNLEATQVTDDGVQRLTAALPNLAVNDD
jgi:Leucine-rich repeat (LRR) protein